MANVNEIIVVKQLPVIEEHLKSVKEDIQRRTDLAVSLVCTEDTIKEIKKTRSELNKEFTAYETARKEIKEQVMHPYNDFEAVYKDCISDIFKTADSTLKDRISEVEGEVKKAKEQDVVEYFNEYRVSKGIDFINYEDAGIIITLTASKKSLKEQAKKFIDKVVEDIEFIQTLENNTEVLVEYKQCLNITQAMRIVASRNALIAQEKEKAIQATKRQEQEMEAVKKVEQIVVEATVEPLTPPIESKPVEPEKQYTTTFKVTGTLEQLKQLKRFLEEGGYTYEQ